jgi:hypothetical protein
MKIIIIDIDGTVSKVGDRLKYLKESPKNWDAFYNSCFEDEPIQEIIDFLHIIQNDYKFVFCTGRRESVRFDTSMWLENNGLFGDLLMRPDNDFRHDTIVKPEQLEKNNILLDEVAFVLEDRNAMVEKFRELGLRVLQVADGNF